VNVLQIVLHSTLTSTAKEQRVAFDSPPAGVTKVNLGATRGKQKVVL